MLDRRPLILMLGLLAGCGDGGCSGSKGTQVTEEPAPSVAMQTGCDPDSLPAMSCFVFPVSTAQETLLRDAGAAHVLAGRLAKRKVAKVVLKDEATVLSTLQVDEKGRIVSEREGGTTRTIGYDEDGRVTQIRIEAEGALFLEKMVLRAPEGDLCAVTTTLGEGAGGPRSESVRCWTEGTTLFRETPYGTVQGTIGQGRVDYANGGWVAMDSKGRIVERKDGAGVARFEHEEGRATELREAGDDWRELNVVVLDGDGLPLRQIIPAAPGHADRVLTFTYESRP